MTRWLLGSPGLCQLSGRQSKWKFRRDRLSRSISPTLGEIRRDTCLNPLVPELFLYLQSNRCPLFGDARHKWVKQLK